MQSDYRSRGYSVSAGRPVATLDLSYDEPAGVYANGSVVLAPPREGDATLVALVGAFGYARNIAPRLSLDAGVMRSEYFRGADGHQATGYTEVYAGLVGRRLSAHVFYSPDYFRPGVSTVYLEADGVLEPTERVRLTAHVGVLNYLSWPPGRGGLTTQYDWRLGASRQVGPVALSAAVSGGGPAEDYYRGRSHSRTALVVGATWAF